MARYRDQVRGFLSALETRRPDLRRRRRDGTGAPAPGLVPRVGNRDQLHAVHLYPALVREMPRPSVLVQWIVAARQPELLRGLALAPNVGYALGFAK